jgi:hypothetical protein
MNKLEQKEMNKLTVYAKLDVEIARRGVDVLLRAAKTQKSKAAIIAAAQAANII